jgi:hypothetical protein
VGLLYDAKGNGIFESITPTSKVFTNVPEIEDTQNPEQGLI